MFFNFLLRHRIRETDHSLARGLNPECANTIIVHHPSYRPFVVFNGIQQGAKRLFRRAKHRKTESWEFPGILASQLVARIASILLPANVRDCFLIAPPFQRSNLADDIREPRATLERASVCRYGRYNVLLESHRAAFACQEKGKQNYEYAHEKRPPGKRFPRSNSSTKRSLLRRVSIGPYVGSRNHPNRKLSQRDKTRCGPGAP